MNRKLIHAGQWLACVTMAASSLQAHAGLNFDQYVVTPSIEAKAAAYVYTTGSILALVPSSAPQDLRNTVTELSNTGELLNSTYIGINPGVMALSDDASIAYVGMIGAPVVRAYDVGARTAGLEIQLPRHWAGTPGASESRTVALAISPTDNGTLSVLSRGLKIRDWTELRVFSDGQPLPKIMGVFDPDSELPYITGITDIAYSEDGSVLYGAEGNTASRGLHVMQADAQGLTYLRQMATPVSNQIDLDGSLLYTSDGRVIDLDLDIQMGLYNGNGRVLRVVHDTASGLVFGAYGNGDVTVFDLATFTPITTFSNHLSLSNVTDLVSLGHGDLAMIGAAADGVSRLYLMRAVPELSSSGQWAVGALALSLLYARRRQSRKAGNGQWLCASNLQQHIQG